MAGTANSLHHYGVEPYARVNSLEQSLANAVNDSRFIPYIP